MKTFIIVDVDDTIFKSLTSSPMPYAKEALWKIKNNWDTKVVYVTGRIFDPTKAIKEAGFPCDLVIYRKIGNKFISFFIPTIIMKRFVVHLFKKFKMQPLRAFDNDRNVVTMYRNNGIPTTIIKGPETWKRVLEEN